MAATSNHDSVEAVLEKSLNKEDLEFTRRVLYGKKLE
jgi:hypothetical protein